MSQIFTAPSSDDVCLVCAVPADDHMVRDWRLHNPPFDEMVSKPIRPFENPSVVLIGDKPNYMQGVRIGAMVVDLGPPVGTMGVLTYRFINEDGDALPDILYPARDAELHHVVGLTREAAKLAINGRIKYKAPKGIHG